MEGIEKMWRRKKIRKIDAAGNRNQDSYTTVQYALPTTPLGKFKCIHDNVIITQTLSNFPKVGMSIKDVDHQGHN